MLWSAARFVPTLSPLCARANRAICSSWADRDTERALLRRARPESSHERRTAARSRGVPSDTGLQLPSLPVSRNAPAPLRVMWAYTKGGLSRATHRAGIRPGEIFITVSTPIPGAFDHVSWYTRTQAEMLGPNPLLRVLSRVGLCSTGALLAPRSRAPRLPSVAPVCRTIDDVIGRMTDLGDRFEQQHGPRDGLLCFHRLYLAVTRGVKGAVEQPGYFPRPRGGRPARRALRPALFRCGRCG